MRDLLILLIHLLTTLARLMGPGGLRAVVAESLLVKQQLLILNRSRHRAPNLCASDRVLAGVCALFMRPARVMRSAIVLRPSTILGFHRTLRQRKYRLLFSPKHRRSGPQGPSKELIDAIVAIKRRNPTWGCRRIAQQIALAFDIDIDKDVVRRVLAAHYRPDPNVSGPSWLTFLGHAKDSLWSVDLFRCESAILRTHWVLVVMDQCTLTKPLTTSPRQVLSGERVMLLVMSGTRVLTAGEMLAPRFSRFRACRPPAIYSALR